MHHKQRGKGFHPGIPAIMTKNWLNIFINTFAKSYFICAMDWKKYKAEIYTYKIKLPGNSGHTCWERIGNSIFDFN